MMCSLLSVFTDKHAIFIHFTSDFYAFFYIFIECGLVLANVQASGNSETVLSLQCKYKQARHLIID